jgi:membrane peptidoglycan carboxypeptidase
VQILAPEVAQKMSDVLSDQAARASLGQGGLFAFPGHEVAIKTGTTNNYRDAWTIGFTPNIVVGAWAGNNNNTPMERRVSGFIIGPAWAEFMSYALTKYPPTPFTRAEYANGEKPVLNGIWQIPGADGQFHDILYWVDKDNPQGGGNSINDSQYRYWEYAVQSWLANNPGAFNTGVGTTTTNLNGAEDCFIDPRTGQCEGQQVPSPVQQQFQMQNGTVPR